jgi:hypothetical protein
VWEGSSSQLGGTLGWPVLRNCTRDFPIYYGLAWHIFLTEFHEHLLLTLRQLCTST